MKVSIITAVYNGADHIACCLESVKAQSHPDIEHIIVDGCSTDWTVDIARETARRGSKLLSQPDRGIYDAINKGIGEASGKIIGTLNADDFYAHANVVSNVVSVMADGNTDSCYGDLQYVDKDDVKRVLRHWRSGPYRQGLFLKGWMPPHPTFFVKRGAYEKYGWFNREFRIAADYELMLRFMEKHRISVKYIPEVLVKMRAGGISNRSIKNMLEKTAEDYRAWRANGLSKSFYTIPLKNLSKIKQFFARP